MTEDMLSWLRATIEGDKQLAEASANKPRRIPYLEDGEWKYRPAIDDGVWAYEEVREGYYRGQARVISTCGENMGVVAGACRCCGGTPAEGRKEDLLHIVANDPQDTIARCEADLAILDEHAPEPWFEGTLSPANCCRCWNADAPDPHEPASQLEWPCNTLRWLAYARRHRPGYNPAWAPEGVNP